MERGLEGWREVELWSSPVLSILLYSDEDEPRTVYRLGKRVSIAQKMSHYAMLSAFL